MARQIESDLYQELRNSKFSFIERGIRFIYDIYDAVKIEYPELCDDLYSCSENCRLGNDQPEWNHTVRNALGDLKSNNGPITHTGRKGIWNFQ